MVKRKLQLALNTINVQDKKLIDALDSLEEYATEAEPILEARATSSKPFNVVPGKNAVVAEREAAILERYKDKLVDGAQIRVGGYILTVVEYQQMDEVTHRPAFKLKKPLRVDDVGGDDDEE